MQTCVSFDQRTFGVLLHPTSLPGPWGSGDIGPGAVRFLDYLVQCGATWWQMLPVVPPDAGFSPYSSDSAFAGSPWLISLEVLRSQNLLDDCDLRASSKSAHRVEPKSVVAHRSKALRLAAASFIHHGQLKSSAYKTFLRQNQSWLDDYSLFKAIKSVGHHQPWNHWPAGLRSRDPKALAQARRELTAEIDFHNIVQFFFAQQWEQLKREAARRKIKLLGDIPIFVSLDSADVWANQDLFELDKHGKPTIVTGCPPDIFTKDGQLWGHPHYRWNVHKESGYAWWTRRFAGEFSRFDGVRIDHFLGFNRAWAVKGGAKTARKGKWIPGPRFDFFAAIEKRLGKRAIIAEDLGLLTPEAIALRDHFKLPGMKIMQFAFGTPDAYHAPHTLVPNMIYYTGTHDNQTMLGWWKSQNKKEQAKAVAYMNADHQSIVQECIRTGMASVANTFIVPMQDILNLDDKARMNIPGTSTGNWCWRMSSEQLNPKSAKPIREMVKRYGRLTQ